MKRLIILFFLLLNLPCSSYTSLYSPGQIDTTDFMFRDDAERILQDTDDDSEDSELMDYLDDLRRNPVDINTADTDQLVTIPFITPVLARRITEYRNTVNYFSSKRELLNVGGIDERIYELISSFIIARRPKILKKKLTEDNISVRSLSGEFRSIYLSDLQIKKGYLNGAYEGARPRFANRLRVIYDAGSFNLRAGIATDKDPGEKNYADFISAFASMQMNGLIRSITIGDYQISFGSGLALSNLFRSPKSFESSARFTGNVRLRPYASTGEADFFRGIATELVFGKFSVHAFFSVRSLDATIDTLTGLTGTIYRDGYHRTSSELSRKDKLREVLYGGRIGFYMGLFKSGISYYQTKYDPAISIDTVKKLYGFHGSKQNILGLDASFIRGPLAISGELAASESGAIAFFGNLNLQSGNMTEIILSARRYPFDFFSAYSRAPGERSDAANESGFLTGIRIKPAQGIALTAVFDQYSFPYRTYYNPVPTRGKDLIFNFEYKIQGGSLLNLRIKNEIKEEAAKFTDDLGRSITQMIPRDQFNIRMSLEKGSKNFRLRCRYEYCLVSYSQKKSTEKGSLLYGDVSSQISDMFGITGRVIFFHTDGYDSRIYEFEREIPGVVSNHGLYGKGVRWYLMTVMKPFTGIKLSAKYAETFYSGVRKTGSGNDEVSGDLLNRFLLSLEVKF